jgi:hypothetical protein
MKSPEKTGSPADGAEGEASPVERAAGAAKRRGARFRKSLLEKLPRLPFGNKTISDVLDVRADLGTLTELDAEAVIGQLEALVVGQRK